MKRIIGITAALICSFFLQNPVIAQEATANPNIIKTKPVFEKPIKKDFKSSEKMPCKIKKVFQLFKFADELQLTDEQIIKLRAFYKKYNSEKPVKKEPAKALNMIDFYKMTDEELVKYAEDEAMKKKQELMSKLQKIIEIRKILSKDQLDLIQKEAENRRKEFEDKKAKNRHSRKPIAPRKFMVPPMCCPQMGMMPQPPMPHQPFMMPHNNMLPMGCPQMGMMPQPPMPHQPFMMPHNNMPPMGCPQMGMMPQPPMRPMPKFDKQDKCKEPKHKFAKKNHFPMMNPMGFYPGYMAQPNVMGCCPCQMRPPMPGFRKNIKEKRPPFDFLMKLFSCKKEKDSDIIQIEKENKSEKADKNQPKVPLTNEEKK